MYDASVTAAVDAGVLTAENQTERARRADCWPRRSTKMQRDREGAKDANQVRRMLNAPKEEATSIVNTHCLSLADVFQVCLH